MPSFVASGTVSLRSNRKGVEDRRKTWLLWRGKGELGGYTVCTILDTAVMGMQGSNANQEFGREWAGLCPEECERRPMDELLLVRGEDPTRSQQ